MAPRPTIVVTVSIRTEAVGDCGAYEDLLAVVPDLAQARELLRQEFDPLVPPLPAWPRVPGNLPDELQRYLLTTNGESCVVAVWRVRRVTADAPEPPSAAPAGPA